jgi:hypothetical protein
MPITRRPPGADWNTPFEAITPPIPQKQGIDRQRELHRTIAREGTKNPADVAGLKFLCVSGVRSHARDGSDFRWPPDVPDIRIA